MVCAHQVHLHPSALDLTEAVVSSSESSSSDSDSSSSGEEKTVKLKPSNGRTKTYEVAAEDVEMRVSEGFHCLYSIRNYEQGS